MNQMEHITATGISPGMGTGQALVFRKLSYRISSAPATSTQLEMDRYENALQEVIDETTCLMEQAKAAGEHVRISILRDYLALMCDAALTQKPRELIANFYNAAMAVQEGYVTVIEMLEGMEDEFLRKRARVARDLKDRILSKVLGIGRRDLSNLEPNTIIVAHELTTIDAVKMDVKNIAGIITVGGSQDSHASIIANSFDIPSVIRARNALEKITDGDMILIDGTRGEVCVNPTEDYKSEFLKRRWKYLSEKEILRQFLLKKTETADGEELKVFTNVSSLSEITKVHENAADGIGLFRSEYLFIDSNSLIDEETQFGAYRELAASMNGLPVIIRTMDAGGDKELPVLNLEHEDNPQLGLRGIRLSLGRTDLFRTQLRAILRASVYGNIRIMFPMITALEELREAKQILEEVKQELRAEKKGFSDNVMAGMMIEVPAAAAIAPEFARECDFFSIGTNDLIQYATAVDRNNPRVSHLYSHYHPGPIRGYAFAVESAYQAGIPCGMCGEAAGDPLFIPLAIGMGVNELSMSPSMILKARYILSKLTLNEMQTLSGEIMNLSTTREVHRRLIQFSAEHGLT